MQLTQKETSLLKDLKDQEQVCVEKYNNYAQQACDPQLKTLFSQIAGTEQQHLDTINQIMSGSVPTQMGQGQGQQQGQQQGQGQQGQQMQQQGQGQQGGQQGQGQMQSFSATYKAGDQSQEKKKDCYLCTDLLSTEKHVSSTYNTSIFEFRDPNIRNTLNHIQKEEQQHGEQIYNYMAQNGMYSS